MISLKFGERADAKNFPMGSDEWDLPLVFGVEKHTIDDHLREQAGAHWRALKNRDAALGQIKALNEDVADKYAPHGDLPVQRIYDDAARGTLKRAAPSQSKIRAMTVLLVLAVAAESTVMVLQQALTLDFNPFILVIAFMLAIGGFLQGHGVGNLLVNRWKEDTARAERGERSLIYWIEVGVGTLLILLIAVMRGGSAFQPAMIFLVFSITVLFGEAVSLFEALREKHKVMRATLLSEMLQAQKWYATLTHQQHLDRKGYLETYVAAYDLAAKTGAQVNASPPPDATSAAPRNA
jgi:hypothetical protein